MEKRGEKMVLDDLAISVPESVLFQELSEGVVLLHIESGEYYGLNEVGSRIWTLLQEGTEVGEILRRLTREYDVSEEQLRKDIEQFLCQLQNKRLIEIHEKETI